jgi:hypothetical protein
MLGNCRISKQLRISRVALCSMELVNSSVVVIRALMMRIERQISELWSKIAKYSIPISSAMDINKKEMPHALRTQTLHGNVRQEGWSWSRPWVCSKSENQGSTLSESCHVSCYLFQPCFFASSPKVFPVRIKLSIDCNAKTAHKGSVCCH